MKILAIRTPDGCGQFRVAMPAAELRLRGHTVVEAINPGNSRVANTMLAGYDALILQKISDPGWFRLVNSIPEQWRPRTIYEADDALWELDPRNPQHTAWSTQAVNVLACMALADAVTVPTPGLARELRRELPGVKVYVVPNFLDLNTRNWKEGQPRLWEGLTIGWAGGSHHFGDDAPIAEGLRAALRQRPGVRFAIMGDPYMFKEWAQAIGVPDRTVFLGSETFEEFPSFLARFDIGVAPLAPTRFNRCKSDLKLLEYGAWGIPYVASDIEPYSRYNREADGGGYLASSPKEWERYLLHLIDSETSRQRAGKRGKQHVWYNRGPRAMGNAWERALTAITKGKECHGNGTVSALPSEV